MIGIDVTEIGRVAGLLARHPSAESRLFTESERAFCRSFADPAIHFAGTFAAKEAVVKALQLQSIVTWARRIEILRGPTGRPFARIADSPRDAIPISISHDGNVAIAVAILQLNGWDGADVKPCLAWASDFILGSDFP